MMPHGTEINPDSSLTNQTPFLLQHKSQQTKLKYLHPLSSMFFDYCNLHCNSHHPGSSLYDFELEKLEVVDLQHK